MFVVILFRDVIPLLTPLPQATDYADTTVGVPFVNEATLVVEFAPNNDGELKVKHVEEFLDSKFTVEFMKAVQASRNS
jgi:hypothetical protein